MATAPSLRRIRRHVAISQRQHCKETFRLWNRGAQTSDEYRKRHIAAKALCSGAERRDIAGTTIGAKTHLPGSLVGGSIDANGAHCKRLSECV